MFLTIAGAILLVLPFTLLTKYKDKTLGFAYIFSFWLAFHVSVALLSQLFHIFTYPVILGANLVAASIIVGIAWPGLKTSFQPRGVFLLLKQNWVPIAAVAIAFFCLYSVHYNYSGKYSVAVNQEYQQAKHMKYEYPYFADEWYSVAFIQDSINSHSLPIRNPITRLKIPFVNFEIPFHSVLSELFLLLRLNPLTSYPAAALVCTMTICSLAYLLLRQGGVGKTAAAITGLLLLYITNGSNLPGLWMLIPVTLGTIALLLGFIFLLGGKKLAALLTTVLVLLLYPPFFPFYILAVTMYVSLSRNSNLKQKMNDTAYFFSLCVVVGFVISLAYFAGGGNGNFFTIIVSKLFYRTLTDPFNPNFPIRSVVPLLSLLLLPFGLYALAKKHIWLAASTVLGLVLWIVYSRTTVRIFIEYERVVFLTSLLIVITGGFGLQYVTELLKKHTIFKDNNILNYFQTGILVCFLLLAFTYTRNEAWTNFTASASQPGKFLKPAAVANNYLLPEDLFIFKDIHGKNFLSLPWKGTVLGVATDNYPATVKTGTIGIYPYLANEFIASDCVQKAYLAQTYRLDYVYLPPFDCPQFKLINHSAEGLYLYRFNK